MASKQRVPTVEEIRAMQQKKQELGTIASGATGPIMIEAPEPITQRVPEVVKAHAIRIPTPPVSTEPTDQTPTETLSLSEGSARKELPQILEDAGIDPVMELLHMYNERHPDDHPDPEKRGAFVMSRRERADLMKELVKYKHPQLKSVDHKGMTNNGVTVVLMMPDGSKTQTITEQRGKVIDA